MQGRYSRAGQYKRAKREERKLKTYFGRVLRDGGLGNQYRSSSGG